MSNNVNPVLLVGAGKMAIEYAKVLIKQNIPFVCVGRSTASAESFKDQTGITPETGGLINFLEDNTRPVSSAIVCVNVEELSSSTLALLKSGCKFILVEKPGGLTGKEIKMIAEETKKQKAKVYVAYNRRFYASVKKAKALIEEDGGIDSFHFEFTELSHLISNTSIHSKVKENWLLANSSHVIDLAFYLGGEPQQITSFTKGGTDWHPSASVFAGAGITDKNALFSYNANWDAPGRWGIDLMTKKRRLILRPLEQLQEQTFETFSLERVSINDQMDKNFKPGLFSLVQSFLSSQKDTTLVSIEEQYRKTLSWYQKINHSTKVK